MNGLGGASIGLGADSIGLVEGIGLSPPGRTMITLGGGNE
jgi:hypothetical protein